MSRRMAIPLGADDWARSRFVRSLLFETAQAVLALKDPYRHRYHRAWLDTIDQAHARARLPVLGALTVMRGWVPDFMAPAPRPGDRSVDDELADVADYPPALVAADLIRSLESHPTRQRRAVLEPLIADPPAALGLVVSELHWAWTALIAPFWLPVRELISADIAFRSREITRAGLGLALGDLHSSVTWADGALTIDPAGEDLTLDLAGHGLALLPSAFVWPSVIVVHEATWTPTLVYPARGIGDLWSAPDQPSTGLAGVLGNTRALLITDLDQPATTTTLAARHQLSPAAVSVQLARLRDAGLVTSRRLGKEVHYRRTPLAEALVLARPGTAPPR